MCLLLFHINPKASSDEYYLILISVRDEIYDRPTQKAKFWDKYPNILGGMDLEPGKEGGTWLAMNKAGKIAALLNILQPDEEISFSKKGRGFLVVDYLNSSEDGFKYLEEINQDKINYNAFTLVTLDLSCFRFPKICYVTSCLSSVPTVLESGVYAFGNSVSVEIPWPKVSKAKENFTKIVENYTSWSTKTELVEELFKLLLDPTCYACDVNMKEQGKNKSSSFLKKLSAIFVQIPEYNYGSRCHTIILISGSGKVNYFEKSKAESADMWDTQEFSFNINSL